MASMSAGCQPCLSNDARSGGMSALGVSCLSASALPGLSKFVGCEREQRNEVWNRNGQRVWSLLCVRSGKIEYAIDRFAMEVKRQLDVLDRRLVQSEYIAGGTHTIADMAIFPWYGCLAKGWL